MLEALSTRTQNLNQHVLQVTCELAKAKWGLKNGQEPGFVYESIQSAKKLVSQYKLSLQGATCMLMQIGSWEIYGRRSLITGEQTKAFNLLNQMISNQKLSNFSRKDHSLLHSKYAYHLYNNGQVSDSIEQLKRLRTMYPFSTAKSECLDWFKIAGIIIFDDALNRNDLKCAKRCIQEWEPNVLLDESMKMTVDIRRALLINRLGRTKEVYI
jgi:hypothetical protein